MSGGLESGFDPATERTFTSSILPQNISAYFRRPSKITKSGSRNPSPRNSSARRMTANFPARTRSVVEPQRHVDHHADQLFSHTSPARPISWHSSFAPSYPEHQLFHSSFYQQTSTPIYHDAVFAHGLVTPLPLPIGDETYLDPQVAPLSLVSTQQHSYAPNPFRSFDAYPANFDDHTSSYTPVSAPIHDVTDYQIQTMAWPPLPTSGFPDITTAPASPDFLPHAHLEQIVDDLPQSVDENKEELIGMGLYDSPAQVQSASLLFGGSSPSRRKSLKLEESFVPSPTPEAEDEDDAESESELSMEEELMVEHEMLQPQQILTPCVPDSIREYYDNLTHEEVPFIPMHHYGAAAVVKNVPYGWI